LFKISSCNGLVSQIDLCMWSKFVINEFFALTIDFEFFMLPRDLLLLERFVKILPAFFCLFFCLGSWSAFAKDIPYNPDFPQAEFPYAQAPDGCSGWSDPGQVRDNWGPVSFVEACNTHDRCYYTVGSQVDVCNSQFEQDLLDSCERDTSDPFTLELCNGLAKTYHFAVVEAVSFGFFDRAQDMQISYESWTDTLP
jgi:hypothetical protein